MGVHLFKKLFLEGTGTSCSWSVLFISSNRNMSISNWLLMVVDRLNLPWKFSIDQKSTRTKTKCSFGLWIVLACEVQIITLSLWQRLNWQGKPGDCPQDGQWLKNRPYPWLKPRGHTSETDQGISFKSLPRFWDPVIWRFYAAMARTVTPALYCRTHKWPFTFEE